MTLSFFLLVLSSVALGPQLVFSLLNISFSDVEQCGSVSISFTGQELAKATATRFTLLPFNSHPIPISIPAPLINTTVSFLPLPAGTQFIALLDDPAGKVTDVASGVTSVLPSPANTTSCLPPVIDMNRRYSVDQDNLTQCQNFSVTYNGTQGPPTVRLVVAQSWSTVLRPVGTEPDQSRATYTLSAGHGQEVVLLFSDNDGYSETSQLFSIKGDNSSDDICLLLDPTTPNNVDPNQTMMGDVPGAPSGSSLSRVVIIAVSAGAGGLVVVVIFLMTIYVIRDRRRKRKSDITYLEAPPDNWQSVRLPPTPPTAASFSAGFVINPPYVTEKYSSVMSPRSSTSSWVNVSVTSGKNSLSSSLSNQATIGSRPRVTSSDGSRSSISTTDIRQILGLSVIKEYSHSRSNSAPSFDLPAARASHLSNGLGSSRASSILPMSPKLSSSPMFNHQRNLTVGYVPRLQPGRSRGSPDVPMDTTTSSLTLSALFPIPPTDIPTPPASPGVTGRYPVEPLQERPAGYTGDVPKSPAPFAALNGVPTDCGVDGDVGPVAEAHPRYSRAFQAEGSGNRDTTYSTGSIWYGVAQ